MELARLHQTRRPTAGRVLAVITALPAAAVAGWLLAGLPLLLLGVYRPLPAFLIGLSVAALLCWTATRHMGATVPATGRQVAGVIAVAAGSGVFNAVMHSEQLAVRRDPGTYAQYAIWLAEHGSLPIPSGAEAFGGADPGLIFRSVGFYAADGAVVPQFMPGAPMLFAVGEWLGGLLVTPAVLGALAVLAFAGLVARLAGGGWAVPAALAFAVCMPVLYTSRTTFSEIPSMILLFGGLILIHDTLRRDTPPGRSPGGAVLDGDGTRDGGPGRSAPGRWRPSARWLRMALAGLVFGLCVLVRVDGLRDVLPALAFAGLLIALGRLARSRARAEHAPRPPASVGAKGRSRASGGDVVGAPGQGTGWVSWPGMELGGALLTGLVAGVGVGLLAAQLLARPYLDYLSRSVEPLLLICAAVLLLTLAGTVTAPLLARVRLPRRLPEAGAVLAVLVMAGLAVRPWLQTVRREPDNDEDWRTHTFIEEIQKANGLPIDGTRLYFENSLHWVAWYIGVPALVLATLAAAVLVRRLLKGGAPEWLLPLAVIGWTTVTTLLRPEITPDHPWAARRLVPIVIPGLILLAVWGAGWLRERGRGWRFRRWIAPVSVLLLLAPPIVTSIGTAFTPVERGEEAAVAALCARIPPDASVLMVERVTGDRFTQVVRGRCGVPVAMVGRVTGDTASERDVRRLIERVRAVGRTPVVLGAERGQVSPYGTASQVMALVTRQDERSLTERPNGTWSLRINVWMAVA
ncbi:hypothetical protein ACIBQX_25195 [Nonomuraea sp. NPDC049714]|uniref:hypothetical protein n=1 Tax=Nonomuraea sp. NPDC049714 TaxID=3364357 RepID=UPI0037B637FD